MRPREWLTDIALGVRLSVGGGRTSWARLALSTVGIAVAVAVLLVAASVGTMSDNRSQRQANYYAEEEPVAGVEPTLMNRTGTDFRGQTVSITYVAPTAPYSPKPASMPELPKPGEMYASQALVDLLASEDGKLLRPRLPEKIVATLDKDMVGQPADLVAWVGVDEETLAAGEYTGKAYGFGSTPPERELDPSMLILILIGAVVVLLPVFIFITSASRIAGAERDRRLAALRLVGSGSLQVRRIAAAEALVSAVSGLAVGALVFVVGRQFAESIALFGEAVYVSDVVPDPTFVVLIVLLIPALAVLTALFALRRTIIEPLGVVRHARPVRRRAWWRFALIIAGVVLMATQLGFEENTDAWGFAISGGAALLLIGVPVLLPWLVERVAGKLSGGPSSWLLAVRRLQLDSGTSARVVGGVAVVLAGAIALQTVLLSVEGKIGLPGTDNDDTPGAVVVSSRPALGAEIERDLAGLDGVESAHQVRDALGTRAETEQYSVAILDCRAMRDLLNVRDCEDGDVFGADSQYMPTPEPGAQLEFREYQPKASNDWDPQKYTVSGTWTVPPFKRDITLPMYSSLYASVLATPGAVGADQLPKNSGSRVMTTVSDNVTSDQLETIRNSLAALRLDTNVYTYNTGPDLTRDQQTYLSIRTGLYAGSVFTLLLAGISLLVLALEHIRERRRQLAVLTATGVPRGVLGRSLLWQVALPIGLGVLVALVTGIGLAALVMRLTGEPFAVDWAGVALLSTAAIVLSLLVSAMTMPFLRSATRLTALRTE